MAHWYCPGSWTLTRLGMIGVHDAEVTTTVSAGARRHYALREKAIDLGWSKSIIRILDRDLGKTGTEMSARNDFNTLVADVSMGQVGAVFALGLPTRAVVSRLASAARTAPTRC